MQVRKLSTASKDYLETVSFEILRSHLFGSGGFLLFSEDEQLA